MLRGWQTNRVHARANRHPSLRDQFFWFDFALSLRYNPELTAQWTREIADEIKNKLKNDLELPRYKYMVQVVVGEQRGEGVRMGCRTFWDRDTDAYASETFTNDSIFCVATAYAVYLN